ncbi:MAG: amidohydrolase family protein, partial [Acidobacteria bacterium]|nr:amidohydrolase family protein [Acidobacteriota bacterium]
GELRQMVELATEECLAKGLTTFHDAGSPLEVVDLFTRMADEGALKLRLWVMVRDSNDRLVDRLAEVRKVGYADNHLTVRAIKHSIDGALGSHGAWLLEPYTDMPQSTGLNTTPVPTIEETARLALEHRYQLCVHAIGDRANRETLDIYEAAYAQRPGEDLRWRVEHAQHLNPAEVPRFARLGAIASMQAVHCTSDGPWVPQRLGEKRSEEGAYVWRKLMEAGAVVTNGTDAPVEDVDPLPSYYAAVTRRMANGEVFYGDQVMTREEALRSYTANVAYSGFEEDLKGTLEPGKLADVTVLSKDILTVPEEEILDAKVLYTIVGGEVEYSGEG